MNESLITKIRKRLTARLDQTKPTGVLCDEEMETLCALYQVLAADEDFPRNECVDFFNRRTLDQPGRLHAYREGLALLTSRCPEFTHLSIDERDAVLKKMLRSYPHRSLESAWRRRLRLTGAVWDRFLTSARTLRFRDLVARDLLSHYYTSGRGWQVVAYDEYLGYVRTIDEQCEVTSIDLDGPRLVLTLSDATVEVLEDDGLRISEDGHFRVVTKWGRQTATLSRRAHNLLAEVLEEDDAGFFVRAGERCYRVMELHA